MNRSMIVLCMVVLAFLRIKVVCCHDMKGDKAYRDPLLSGLIFTEDLVFQRKVKSKISCASLCLKTDQCVTFTFTPVTSADDVCRGHSAGMGLSKAHQASGKTNLYAFRDAAGIEDWLDTACTGDQDCSQTNSRCFRDKCTCTQGYFYSGCTKACLDSCNPEDLQDTYLPYPGSVTWDTEGWELARNSFDENGCKQACSSDPACLYFEYSESEGRCVLESINPRNKPSNNWREDKPSWNYYQKKCL